MALKKTVTQKHGLTATDAYHRVEDIRIASKTEMTYVICSYVKATGFPAFERKQMSCPYKADGENPFKQAYRDLKTRPAFSEADDV